MSQEILYTSAPRGLRQGSRGYCTVLATPGMSKTLVEQLESLSGYKHVYPPHSSEAKLNPPNFSHLILSIGGHQHHVLSRIGDAGLDYTQRSNKVAHHVALERDELVPAGPARVLAKRDFMETTFDGEPRIIQAGRKPPRGDAPPAVCRHWQQLSGDAGWAGVLAETAVSNRGQQAVIIFRPGMELLPLFVEALALVPPQRRWEVTFSTYFTRLPSGLACQWRGVLEGSDECKAARRLPRAQIIDLCSKAGKAPAGPLVEAARTGSRPAWPESDRPAPADGRSVRVEALPRGETPVAPPPVAETTRHPAATDSGVSLESLLATPSTPRIVTQQVDRASTLPTWFVAVAALLFLVGTAGGFYAGMLVGRGSAVVAVVGPAEKTSATTAGRQDTPQAAANAPPVTAPPEGDAPPPDAEQTAPAQPDVSESPPQPTDQPATDTPPPQAESPESTPAAASDPPAGSPAAAPAAPRVAPTPPPEELWRDLAHRGHILELPDVVGSQTGFVAKPGVQDLAELPGANSANCKLELIGLADAFPKNEQPELIKIEDPGQDETNAAIWEIRAKRDRFGGAEHDKIALLELKDGMLTFKWTPWSANKVDLAGMSLLDRLQNCLLRIRVGNEASQPCHLRRPLLSDPATFSFDQGDRTFPISGIQQLSAVNRNRLRLEVTAVQGVKPPLRTKPNQVRFVFTPPARVGSPSLGFEVEVEAAIRNEEVVIMARTLPLAGPDETKKLVVTTIRQAEKQHRGTDAEIKRIKKEIEKVQQRLMSKSQRTLEETETLQDSEKRLMEQQNAWQFRLQYWDWVVREMEKLQGGAMVKLQGIGASGARVGYKVFVQLEGPGSDGKPATHRLVLTETRAD